MKKVMLVGDFSTVHRNLRDGLRVLGYHADLVSGGDYWKKLGGYADVDVGDLTLTYQGAISVFKRFSVLGHMAKYDLVQFINPFYVFSRFIFLNKFFMKLAFYLGKPIYFLSCGDDAYYWSHGRNNLEYGTHDDFLAIDIKKERYWMERGKALAYNKLVTEKCDGVIPLAYEYYLSYEGHPKRREMIPFPVNVNEISYNENKVRGRLLVYHGATRPGFKGSHYIEEAFTIMNRKYPKDIECIVGGRLPFHKYTELIGKVNVVVDQANSFSWGLNALQSMAAGRVVLGGAEKPVLDFLGVQQGEVPIINIRPSVDNIVEALEGLLERRSEIPEIGYRSRLFCEKHHDHVKVAKRFLDVWER